VNELVVRTRVLHWKAEVLLVLDLGGAARASLAVLAAMKSCVNLIVELDAGNLL
jgi:hypothetical protein